MRSTIHKQNSPPRRTSLIARYCLAAAVLLGLVGPLAEIAQGDFALQGDEELTLDSAHQTGILSGTSRVLITSAGAVANLKTYDFSTADISGGSVSGDLLAYDFSTVAMSAGSVQNLYAYDLSTVDISGGSVTDLRPYMSSIVAISGGSVDSLSAPNSSTVIMSSGSVVGLWASESVTVNISGGSVSYLYTEDNSTVDISGGSVSGLSASDSSVVSFYGRNFRVYNGLVFDGDYVLGTGLLACEWFDGTTWAVNIRENTPSATIRVISDSGPKPVCVKYPVMDFNGDCKVDFSDLAVFLTHWLECNFDPPSACWE